MSDRTLEQLNQLAHLYGLETSFHDGFGQLCQPGPEVITMVLRSLGAQLETLAEVSEALRIRRLNLATRFLEPVTIGWGEQPVEVQLRLPQTEVEQLSRVTLEQESGHKDRWTVRPAELPLVEEYVVDGNSFQRRTLELSAPLPYGYHRVVFERNDTSVSQAIISAPETAWSSDKDRRQWGVFAPVYSLKSDRSWGAGDLSDLQSFVRFLSQRGASFVGTLPLFATFLDEPFDPSPYSPVSRLLWSEFYADPFAAPGWESCPEAREMFDSPGFQLELADIRRLPLVDYKRVMALKRSVLEVLARHFFSTRRCEADSGFLEFLKTSSDVRKYAEFRSHMKRQEKPWHFWSDSAKGGVIPPDQLDKLERDYHLFAQWVTHQQMDSLLAAAREQGVGLYLDMPLGVHPDGYDSWRYSESFAQGVSGGSPPDMFFTAGQDWGFRPLHPERSRENEYRYIKKVMRRLMASSNLIRIDHAMWLHRLYWVPFGAGARNGVYVRYPFEELAALFVLESHRAGCTISGEDLGTVSPVVREGMDKRQILRMYVGEFELSDAPGKPVNEIPAPVVASLDTHDTPTVVSFLLGLDVEERAEMGLLNDTARHAEQEARRKSTDRLMMYLAESCDRENPDLLFKVVRNWLFLLANSAARYVMLTLDDLWLEKHPQNVPGTTAERPNWRRKARLSLDDIADDSWIGDTLREIDRLRKERDR